MGLRKYDNCTDLNGQYATVSGYPIDLSYTQYYSVGSIQNATNDNIDISIDMKSGNSGSPIYDASYYVLGVATKEYNNKIMNIGSRVNEHLFTTASNIINNN